MITCNLSKPESTFDQVRKEYKDLKPTDVALLATALVEAGRFAIGVHDDVEYKWPEEADGMTKSILREIVQIEQTVAEESAAATTTTKTKKAAKTEVEEAVTLTVLLRPNVEAAEAVLGEQEKLKTLLSDLLEQGVEYLYSPTDIGWQWALERANWQTFDENVSHRYKFKADFDGNSVAIELGPGGKRRSTRKRKS